jgi:predicted DNA-binding transcriptional regulator AlpA
MSEVLLTQDKVADILQLSPKTLERWRSKRTGPVWYKIGGSPRYKMSDLESWINQQRVVRGSRR